MATIKRCPNESCKNHAEGKKSRFYVKWGKFKPSWSMKKVPRYKCKSCGKTFSSSTSDKMTFGEKRPDINQHIFDLYCSRMTLRRIAKHLKVNRKTVVAKFHKLADRAKSVHEEKIQNRKIICSDLVAIDEMESFEKGKLKPLSIAIAVDGENGRVLDFAVSEQHAKGAIVNSRKLTKEEQERPNNTAQGFKKVLASVRHLKARGFKATIITDRKPAYRTMIEDAYPEAQHIAVSRTDIKTDKNKYDPMWWLNHACAMFRHDCSRLTRKSMVYSKKKMGLEAHLYLYIAWKNHYQII